MCRLSIPLTAHFLRRYFVLKRRIAQGDVTMLHVPDAQMPADVLTKWIPSGKTRQSVQYMTNPSGRTASVMSACAEFDVSALDAAIAGLSDASAVHGSERAAHTAASATQAGGSVVGGPSPRPKPCSVSISNRPAKAVHRSDRS